MDDFRIGSIPPYAPLPDGQRPVDPRRKRPRRPESEAAEEDTVVEQPAAGQPDTLEVEDYYTPSGETEEAE